MVAVEAGGLTDVGATTELTGSDQPAGAFTGTEILHVRPGGDPPSSNVDGIVGVANNDATGVRGSGSQGVEGRGDAVGVVGISADGRGGLFHSGTAAQIRLVPNHRPTDPQAEDPVQPQAVRTRGNTGLPLPAKGEPGDLYALELPFAETSGHQAEVRCTLWLCVQGFDPDGPARWAQVLTGDAVPGTV